MSTQRSPLRTLRAALPHRACLARVRRGEVGAHLAVIAPARWSEQRPLRTDVGVALGVIREVLVFEERARLLPVHYRDVGPDARFLQHPEVLAGPIGRVGNGPFRTKLPAETHPPGQVGEREVLPDIGR